MVLSFSDLGLSPKIKFALAELGYSEPSDVQEKAIPVIRSSRNALVIAPTGSGKTEAAMIPLMDSLLSSPGSRLIYITPLRSLNRDILMRLKRLAKLLGITIALRHGDTPTWEKGKISRDPPTILITTPESLEGLLISPTLEKFLRAVRAVVIDEAQEVTNNKRGIALSYGLERLVRFAGEFQRVALSAYTSDSGAVARTVFGSRKYELVEVRGIRPIELSVRLVGRNDEFAAITEAVKGSSSALVFTNTRETAEWLGKKLGETMEVGVHHGSLSKEVREGLELAFKSGSKKVLVCTSSLELGIDVGSIGTVVQYSSPRRVETLLQRVGRAGHRLGGVARGYIITNNPLDYLESLVIARRALQRRTERFPPPPLGLDVLAHELVGLLLDEGKTSLEEIRAVFRSSAYFGDAAPYLEDVVQALKRLKVVRYAPGEGVIKKTLFTRRYYAVHVSMIPSTYDFLAKASGDRKELGRLDHEFVIAHCQTGAIIRLAGRDWRVEAVDGESREVWLSPTASTGLIPSWEGELIPVDSEVSAEVASLRGFSPELKQLTDAASMARIQDEIKASPLPGYALAFNGFSNDGRLGVLISSPLGSKVNMAFALALSRFLEEHGVSVRFFRDQYKVVVETGLPVDDGLFKEFFSLDDGAIRNLYLNGLLSSPLYLSRLMRVSLRLGLIGGDVIPGQPLLRKIAEAWSGTWVEKEVISEVGSEDADLDGFLSFMGQVRDGMLPLIFKPSGGNIFFLERRAYDLPTATDTVNNRLLATQVKLVCLNCGWENVYRVSELPEKITCPRCGSMMVGCTWPRSETQGLVKKVRTGRKLTPDEKKLANELMRSSNLISQGGRRAAYVLAGRGIGPETATRILIKATGSAWPPLDLVPLIVKAEAEFNRTHMFWKD